ncbi:MAG: tetratricopeptide repeat protein [Fimbriimonadales bacterium]|nr:tetratricopeptide repeat protein [Fimbriimonadales bacterium]
MRGNPKAGLWAGALAILIIVGALYAQTLSFKFVWDDDQVIYGRVDYRSPARWLEAVRQPLDFSPNYFRPLALSSLLVQIWIWKDNPAPFHAANVLLHLLNTALVMALGVRLLRGRWQGLLAGALYGVHPALIESVAFVSSRYDLTATLFLLTALWLEGRLRGKARLLGVGASFLLALLCKEMALTLPFVMLAWQAAQLPEGSVRERLHTLWRMERPLYAALGVVLALYFGIRYAALGYLFTAPIGDAQIDAGTPLQHLLLVGRTLTTLAGLTLFPFFSITPAHHAELPIPLSDGWAWAQLGIAVLMLGGVFWLARRHPLSGGLVIAALISLLPVLNLRPLEFAFGIFTAERFLTFPLALVVTALVARTGLSVPTPHRSKDSPVRANAPTRSMDSPVRANIPTGGTDKTVRATRLDKTVQATALTLLWGVALLITTAYNLPNWRDAESLWKWMTVASPQSPIGFSNLSDLYNKMGRHSEALEYAEKAIQVAPRSGMGYVNKGVALLRLGDPDGAIAQFRKGVEVEPDNITGWNNLGVMLSEKGEYDEAERIIRQHVLGRTPKHMGHQALGLIYSRRARLDLAEAEFRKAHALMPNPAGSVADEGLQQLRLASKWIAAAHHWMNEGKLELAETHLQTAASRDPDKIAYGIALSRLRILQKRPAEAIQILDELRASGYDAPVIRQLREEASGMVKNSQQLSASPKER